MKVINNNPYHVTVGNVTYPPGAVFELDTDRFGEVAGLDPQDEPLSDPKKARRMVLTDTDKVGG